MQNIGRRTFFIVILLAVFVWSLIPPEKKIRLGKDLRGGTTLVYQLEIEPGEDAKSVVTNTIEVLKERVDPNGLYEISIVPQGRDRLEITMPLPSREMQELKRQFEEALDKFATVSLTRSEVLEALRLDGDERRARLEQLSGGSERRLNLLLVAAEAQDAYELLKAKTDEAEREFGPESSEAIEAAMAELPALRARDRAILAVLNATPDKNEVRQALEKPNRGRMLWDPVQRKRVEAPSPRQRAIESLKEKYPEVADLIDEVVARHDAYLAKRTTLDDPSDLKRLLRASGQLSFRITVDAKGGTAASKPLQEIQDLRRRLQEEGPQRAGTSDARWYKINKIESWYDDLASEQRLYEDPRTYFENYGEDGFVVEEFEGEFWILCWDTPRTRLVQGQDAGEWGVASAFQGVDSIGRPAISFVMDAAGAALLGRLTGDHVGDNMAVLLDDQVYTAPRLNSRISRSGIIDGEFSPEEIDYVIKVLSAGSLQAKLSPDPISENTVGPELGADNLRKGLVAGVAALIAVSAFMVIYYFRCGLIAVVALACNAIIILGALSLNRAALTLPGIAGIVLTFGMAVDANVLIYERIREELRAGADARTAVRLGFQKALSSIVDGNVTNLIVCIVLALPGVSTQEVKGFAITLGIGVVATMFSALVIARLIFDWLIHYAHWRKIRMLPTVIPAIERALSPNINWLSLRWIFVGISTCYVSLGLFMVFSQGSKMLDTEFTGGTKITLTFKEIEPGRRLTMELEEVRRRVTESIPTRADTNDDPDDDILVNLRSAEVIPLDPEEGGTVSDQFQVRTSVEDADLIKSAMSEEFADALDEKPRILFAGSNPEAEPRVFPVVSAEFSENFPDPQMRVRYTLGDGRTFRNYIDGVIVLIEDLQPAPTLEDLRIKLETYRQSARPETLARPRELLLLEGSADAVHTAALIIADPELEFSVDPGAWRNEFALEEWQLVREALERVTTLAQVDQFSSAIAETFKGRAIAAVVLSFLFITIYIWVRFGNMRYSLAAMACLLHDVLTVIGLIALAEILYDWAATSDAVRAIGIQPFKIDLNMVAAILTIIGYSLNDTIIVMDRIRENRGKLPYATGEVINRSINETISRTVITSGTTLLTALILYIFGGDGVRAFSFALVMGVIVGTYSSIAVAAPLVWSRRKDPVADDSEPRSA